MTLVAQEQAGRTGRPDCLQSHDDGRRDCGERSNEAGGKFRFSVLDRVEGEARGAAAEGLDILKTGNVHVWNCERLGEYRTQDTHGASLVLFLRGVEARKLTSANHTIVRVLAVVNEGFQPSPATGALPTGGIGQSKKGDDDAKSAHHSVKRGYLTSTRRRQQRRIAPYVDLYRGRHIGAPSAPRTGSAIPLSCNEGDFPMWVAA